MQSTNEDVSTISMSERAIIAAKNLYLDGSNMRCQKNGKYEALVKTADKNKAIFTIGVFTNYLTREQQNIIKSKNKQSDTLQFQKEIATLLLQLFIDQFDNTKKPIFVGLNENGLAILKSIAKGDTTLYKEKLVKNIFKLGSIFPNQEVNKLFNNKKVI